MRERERGGRGREGERGERDRERERERERGEREQERKRGREGETEGGREKFYKGLQQACNCDTGRASFLEGLQMGKNSYVLPIMLIILQMAIEFELIMGEGILGKIDERWEAISRLLLTKASDNYNLQPEEPLTQELQIAALEVLDKRVRSPGATAKGYPLFKIYEVSLKRSIIYYVQSISAQ